MAPRRILLAVIVAITCMRPEPVSGQDNPWRVGDRQGQGWSEPGQDYRPGAPQWREPDGSARQSENASRASGRQGYGYGYGRFSDRESAARASPSPGLAPYGSERRRFDQRDFRRDRQIQPGRETPRSAPLPERERANLRGRFVPSYARGRIDRPRPGDRAATRYGAYPPLDHDPTIARRPARRPAQRDQGGARSFRPAWPQYGNSPGYPVWPGGYGGTARGGAMRSFGGPSTFGNPYAGIYGFGGLPGGLGYGPGLGLPMF